MLCGFHRNFFPHPFLVTPPCTRRAYTEFPARYPDLRYVRPRPSTMSDDAHFLYCRCPVFQHVCVKLPRLSITVAPQLFDWSSFEFLASHANRPLLPPPPGLIPPLSVFPDSSPLNHQRPSSKNNQTADSQFRHNDVNMWVPHSLSSQAAHSLLSAACRLPPCGCPVFRGFCISCPVCQFRSRRNFFWLDSCGASSALHQSCFASQGYHTSLRFFVAEINPEKHVLTIPCSFACFKYLCSFFYQSEYFPF